MNVLGVTSADFSVMDQQLIRLSIAVKYWRKNGHIMVQCISYLYSSVRREVIYNILIDIGIPRKVVGRIKMCK
jgi:hypothetical protein